MEYLEYISQLGIFDFTYEMNIIEQEKLFINFIKKAYDKIGLENKNLQNKIKINEPIESFRINFNKIEESLGSKLRDEKFNVIIAAFLLNENEPTKDKMKRFTESLKNHLELNGIIIILEAPSDYISDYFEINFEKEVGLFRNAPCLNGNKIFDTTGQKKLPFWRPCQ